MYSRKEVLLTLTPWRPAQPPGSTRTKGGIRLERHQEVGGFLTHKANTLPLTLANPDFSSHLPSLPPSAAPLPSLWPWGT